MSKKCKAYSVSKLGLDPADNRKAFYAGWDAALAEQPAIKQDLTPEQHQCNFPLCQSEDYQQALAEQIKRELYTGEPAQQRHISYVCPQCHWSLEKQPAQQEPDWLDKEQAETDWDHVWLLIKAASYASSKGFISGTTNWGSAVSRYMRNESPQPAQQEPVAKIEITRSKHTGEVDGWAFVERPRNAPAGTYSVYTSPPASKPLSDYINRAGINANDSPITVVEKLERAIEDSNQETQRTWQGLTDEEVLDMARTFGAQPWPPGSCVAFGQMIEAKLKEKNA